MTNTSGQLLPSETPELEKPFDSQEALRAVTVQFVITAILFIILALHSGHTSGRDERYAYAFSQMPLAATACIATLSIVWLAVRFKGWDWLIKALPRSVDAPYLIAVCVLFACVWGPVTVVGDFAQDDWRLLAAASVRTGLVSHPLQAWSALDVIDGNFRPLTTNILFGDTYHFFRLSPKPMLGLLFVVNLAGTLLLFALMRELRFPPSTSMLASSLYLSRGMIYTIVGWPCAFGDGFVIMLMAGVVLLVLRGLRPNKSLLAYGFTAWLLYSCALFAKQSAIVIPFAAAITILLSPGQIDIRFRKNMLPALIWLTACAIPTLVVLFHAKALDNGRVPYPMYITVNSIMHLFSYVGNYVFMLDIGKIGRFTDAFSNTLAVVAGVAIVLALAFVLMRNRRLYDGSRRALAFFLLNFTASLALFIAMPNRTLDYYGSMAAFWASMAVSMLLTRWFAMSGTAKSRRFVIRAGCAILLLGLIDIRIGQTALIPSGGYIVGTYSGRSDRATFDNLSKVLRRDEHESSEDIVLVEDTDADLNTYACMSLLQQRSGASRILGYITSSKTWLVNDRMGLRPSSSESGYADVGAYLWQTTLSPEVAYKIISKEGARYIVLGNDGKFREQPGLNL